MSMRRPDYNMGMVNWIGAESVGVPGQRTFRLMLLSNDMSAQLWLEKEQLRDLAEKIALMLLEIDAERGGDFRPTPTDADNPKPPNFPSNPDVEFRVGALLLRYDPQLDLIAIESSELGPDPEEVTLTSFRCLITRKQIELLQMNSIEVISSGRPRCPLCGAPLSEPGVPHFCPSTNGHQKVEEDA